MKITVSYLVLSLTMSLFAVNASAARVWLYQDVLIEAVSYYEISGTKAVQIHMDHANQTGGTYNCAPTSENRIVTHWDGSTGETLKTLLSIAMAAQAQGLRVDIMVETSNCDDSNSWPNPGASGRGFYLEGIRIKGQDYDLPQ